MHTLSVYTFSIYTYTLSMLKTQLCTNEVPGITNAENIEYKNKKEWKVNQKKPSSVHCILVFNLSVWC